MRSVVSGVMLYRHTSPVERSRLVVNELRFCLQYRSGCVHVSLTKQRFTAQPENAAIAISRISVVVRAGGAEFGLGVSVVLEYITRQPATCAVRKRELLILDLRPLTVLGKIVDVGLEH